MTAIVAIILQFLPYLVQAAASIPELVSFLAEIEAIFSRTKIWTPEQQAEFDAKTAALRDDPYWKITD